MAALEQYYLPQCLSKADLTSSAPHKRLFPIMKLVVSCLLLRAVPEKVTSHLPAAAMAER